MKSQIFRLPPRDVLTPSLSMERAVIIILPSFMNINVSILNLLVFSSKVTEEMTLQDLNTVILQGTLVNR